MYVYTLLEGSSLFSQVNILVRVLFKSFFASRGKVCWTLEICQSESFQSYPSLISSGD